MALTDDIVSVWHFDDDWNDSVGANHGAATGAIFNNVDQVYGSACGEWDGIDDSVHLGNNASLNPAQFTISMRLKKIGNGDGSFPGIITTGTGTAGSGYLLVFSGATSAAKLDFYLWNGSSWRLVSSNVAFPTGSWHNVVMRYSGMEVSLWIDKVKQTITQTVSNVVYVGGHEDVYLGKYGASQNADILMDELNFFDVGKSDAEVIELYDAGAYPYDGIAAGNINRKLGKGLAKGLGRGL